MTIWQRLRWVFYRPAYWHHNYQTQRFNRNYAEWVRSFRLLEWRLKQKP